MLCVTNATCSRLADVNASILVSMMMILSFTHEWDRTHAGTANQTLLIINYPEMLINYPQGQCNPTQAIYTYGPKRRV
jgi:hypothetical protein